MLQTILAVFCLLLIPVLLWLIYRLYTRLFPEFYVQRQIRHYVRNYLYKNHYHLVENVSVRDASGDCLILPQVLVSRFGIYILAFCDAKNRIYGASSITWWYSRKGDLCYPFDNPHMQLKSVVAALASHFNVPNSFCESMVVFHEQAKFNHSDFERTGHLRRVFELIIDKQLGYLEPDEFEELKLRLQNSKLSITSDAKRCIIETGILAPQPA